MRRLLSAAATAALLTLLPFGVATAQEAEYPPGENEPEVLPTEIERPVGGDTPTEDETTAAGDETTAAGDEAQVKGLVLSNTGADTAALGAAALGTVALGGGAIAWSRRRERNAG